MGLSKQGRHRRPRSRPLQPHRRPASCSAREGRRRSAPRTLNTTADRRASSFATKMPAARDDTQSVEAKVRAPMSAPRKDDGCRHGKPYGNPTASRSRSKRSRRARPRTETLAMISRPARIVPAPIVAATMGAAAMAMTPKPILTIARSPPTDALARCASPAHRHRRSQPSHSERGISGHT